MKGDELMPTMALEEITALGYLQSIYRNPMQPESRRMRAAEAALPYENAKLSAVAVGHYTKEDFASRLQGAIDRSGVTQIEDQSKRNGSSGAE